MPYRTYEYVPPVRRANTDRLSELIYASSQNEANRIRQSGAAQAAMWQGIGRAGSGMLSELAQYKREEPMRQEAERVRREKDKLRGLEQLAGAGGMSEEERGGLLKREGFVEKGQEIVDKAMQRKATQAVYDDAALKRQEKIYGDLIFRLDKVRKAPDPATAYAEVVGGLKESLGGDKDNKLPPVWDPGAVDGLIGTIETAQDVSTRNRLAKEAADAARDRNTTEQQRLKSHVDSMALQLAISDEEPEWKKAWENFDLVTQDLPAAEKQRLEAQMPFARKFSPEAYERAKELDPRRQTKAQTPIEKADQLFHDQYGHDPKTPAERAEWNQILNSVAEANTPASRSGTNPGLQLANEYQDKLLQLRLQVTKQEIDPEMAAASKAEIDAWYKAQLAQIGQRMPEQTGGGGGAPRISGTPGPGKVLVMSPDGSEGQWESDKAKIAAMVGKGGKVTQGQAPPQGQQPPRSLADAAGGIVPTPGVAPAAPVAPPPPTAPPSAPPAGPSFLSRLTEPVGGEARMFGRSAPTPFVGPVQPRPSIFEGVLAPVGGEAALKTTGEEQGGSMLGGAPPRSPAAPRVPTQSVAPQGPAGSYPPQRSLADQASPTQPMPPEQVIAQAGTNVTSRTPIDQRLSMMTAMLAAAGYDIVPVSKTRSADEQAALYAKGRTSPGTIVTQRSGKPGDESKHQSGQAVDFAFVVNGKPSSDPRLPWHLLGLAAKKVGLEWGGDWQGLVDRPHVQMATPVGPQPQ